MASQPPADPKKKSSLSVSRVILLLILASALVALGFDQYAKYQMGKADSELHTIIQHNEATDVLSLPEPKVHEILAREPTRVKDAGAQRVEEYDYPGVFYVYRLTVRFRKLRPANEYDGHEKRSIFRISGE
jgi:hypothetical protein